MRITHRNAVLSCWPGGETSSPQLPRSGSGTDCDRQPPAKRSFNRSCLTLWLCLVCLATGGGRAFARAPIAENVRLAINSGLKWLARQQRPDGHFPAAAQDRVAVTSLAVMAFLARGYTPISGPYSHVMNRAIDWVLSIQRHNGYFVTNGGTMYDHGIATVMLEECYGMVNHQRRKAIGRAVGRAVAFILAAQKNSRGIFAGGWRYQPQANDADISVTGWQLMALRGAGDCGAVIPASALRDGIAFVLRDAVPNGGFAYQPHGAAGRARTGTGIVALELLGKRNSPQAVSGGDYLLAHPLDPGMQFYFYAVYYCSQAANQLQGRYWRHIYPTIRRQLIQFQENDGSWTPRSGIEGQGGKVYATSMALLALCVPYNYLPLYQR